MSVKSTYNFVSAPNENEVFKPDWADQVNHDIPFSDGESGEIELKITAETPIFIRNGHTSEDAELFKKTLKDVNFRPDETEQKRIDNYLSFSNYNGQYFIPATSLKGMFRNVLEIITNSRMNLTESISEKSPVTYSLRDMNNSEYKADNLKVKSGWLTKRENRWVILSCSNHKLALSDIEKKLKLNQGKLKDSGVKKNKLCKIHINNKFFRFSFLKDLGKWVGDQYNFDEQGDFEGYVVLYGDIDNKKYDYIFSKPSGTSFIADSKLIETLDNIENNGENKEDSLWLYFRKENWQPGIPVFFALNKDNRTVKHFGLSKLYRRNNSHYLHKLEPFKSYLNSNEKDKLDFAELLFGSIRTEALKGRVFISNAWSDNAETGSKEERVLNSPKPSFYPAYLQQNGTKGYLNSAYKTYHDSDGKLRGFKRNPVHTGVKPNIVSDNENISSQFIPIKMNAVFTGKIRYFNLRPFEIGALISAITFHDNSDKFFHSIGGAKPYGFGKVQVEITNGLDSNKYLKNFEIKINEYFEKSKQKEFHLNSNITELLSIASNPKDNEVEDLLVYPLLEKETFVKGKKIIVNEFNEYKKKQEFLEDYSERNGTKSLASKIEIFLKQKAAEEKFEKEEVEKFLREEELNLYNSVRESEQIEELNDFVKKFPTGNYTVEIRAKLEELRKVKNKLEAKKILKENLAFDNNFFIPTKDYLNEKYNKLLKYGFEFSDSQKSQITEQIKKCWINNSDAFKKKKKIIQFPIFPWSDIKKWLGESLAHSLFNELNQTKQ